MRAKIKDANNEVLCVFKSSHRNYILKYTIVWQLLPFQSLRQNSLAIARSMQSYIYWAWKLSARKLVFFHRSWKSGLHRGYNSIFSFDKFIALLDNKILFNIRNIGSTTTTHCWKYDLLVVLTSLCIYTRGARTDSSHGSTLGAAIWAPT